MLDQLAGQQDAPGVFKEDNGVVVFPGVDGAPFRGTAVPNLKQHEVSKLTERCDADVKIFKLNNAEHFNEYRIIMDNIIKGTYVLGTEERQWVPDEKTWYIFLRYYKRFVEQGPAKVHKQGEHFVMKG